MQSRRALSLASIVLISLVSASLASAQGFPDLSGGGLPTAPPTDTTSATSYVASDLNVPLAALLPGLAGLAPSYLWAWSLPLTGSVPAAARARVLTHRAGAIRRTVGPRSLARAQ